VFNTFMDLPLSTLGEYKSLLIDSNAAMPTRAKQAKAVQAERLSKETLQCSNAGNDAIVRSHDNLNCERSAEMTDPLETQSNNRRFGVFWDGLALPVGGY